MTLQSVPQDLPDAQGRQHRTRIAITVNELVKARNRDSLASVTYGTSITFDASAGSAFIVEVTDAVAFAINEPLYGSAGQRMFVLVKNSSGGAMGAITWDSAFKKTAFTNPADGFSRSILFLFDGTNWIQVDQSSVDVPN